MHDWEGSVDTSFGVCHRPSDVPDRMQRAAANKEHADQRKNKIQDILNFVNPET